MITALQRQSGNDFCIPILGWFPEKESQKSSPSMSSFYFNCVVSLVGLIVLKKEKQSALFLKDDVLDILRAIRLSL